MFEGALVCCWVSIADPRVSKVNIKWSVRLMLKDPTGLGDQHPHKKKGLK